jgi:hypothetical protein
MKKIIFGLSVIVLSSCATSKRQPNQFSDDFSKSLEGKTCASYTTVTEAPPEQLLSREQMFEVICEALKNAGIPSAHLTINDRLDTGDLHYKFLSELKYSLNSRVKKDPANNEVAAYFDINLTSESYPDGPDFAWMTGSLVERQHIVYTVQADYNKSVNPAVLRPIQSRPENIKDLKKMEKMLKGRFQEN